ncbi:hypothetical protein ABK040_013764 [Willaertia magna]
MKLLLYGLAIAGLFGPDPIETVGSTEGIKTFNETDFKQILSGTTEIVGYFNEVNVFNDEIDFTVKFFPGPLSKNKFGFQEDLEMEIELEGSNQEITQDNPGTKLTIEKQKHTRLLNCPQKDVFGKVMEECIPVSLFHLNTINYKFYRAKIRILNQGVQADKGMFEPKLQFQYTAMNDSFTRYEIGFRYAFLITSILIFVLFIIFTRFKQQFRVWHTEQKWIAFMLFGLIFYNNPFYIIQYYSDIFLFPLINIIFRVSFIAVLLLSFLIFSHSIYAKDNDKGIIGFYLPKILLIGLLWALTVLSFIFTQISKKTDPAYSFEEFSFAGYVSLAIVILFIIYVLQLGYYIIRGVTMMKELPMKYASKFKLVYGVTIAVLVFAIIATVVSYSLGKLSFFLFLTSHAILNLYPFTLALFFLPSNEKYYSSDEDRSDIRILQSGGENIFGEDDEEELVIEQELQEEINQQRR